MHAGTTLAGGVGQWQAALDIDTRLLAAASAKITYVQRTGAYRTFMGQAHLYLSEIAQAQTDAQAAREQLETAVRLDPDDTTSIQELV